MSAIFDNYQLSVEGRIQLLVKNWWQFQQFVSFQLHWQSKFWLVLRPSRSLAPRKFPGVHHCQSLPAKILAGTARPAEVMEQVLENWTRKCQRRENKCSLEFDFQKFKASEKLDTSEKELWADAYGGNLQNSDRNPKNGEENSIGLQDRVTASKQIFWNRNADNYTIRSVTWYRHISGL